MTGGSFLDTVPRDPGGHLVLNLYAAVDGVIDWLRDVDRHPSAGGGMFDRHAFLASYASEIEANRPPATPPSVFWSRTIETWERSVEQHLPLQALGNELELDFADRMMLMLIGLPEEDSRFGTLFAEIQAPLPFRRATVETLGRILSAAIPFQDRREPWTICRRLIRSGVVRVENAAAARAEQVLRITPPLWDAVRGDLDREPIPGVHHRPAPDCPRIEDLVFPEEFLRRLERVPRALGQGRARVLILRHAPGVDAEEVAGALARRLDLGLLRANRSELPQHEFAALGPMCSLIGAMPLVEYDLAPGETAGLPPLGDSRRIVAVALGFEGGLRTARDEPSLTLEIPFPDTGIRERRWRQAFGATAVDDLAAVRDRFQIAGGYIHKVARSATAHAALRGRNTVRMNDVLAASRQLNRQLLDTLAQPIPGGGVWDDLVSSRSTSGRLRELAQRCRHRERIPERVGSAFGRSLGRGVRALFTGASGTGKTMAARILAAELNMDLYRVDLAAVVNKYVGETEKNLHLVLSRAEALDVLLLLDEGDALMGQRTEVRSANDRYANLETNYLLQRLETYQGVIVVTTNLSDVIDPAFQRRMDIVVPFPRPRAEERRRIWELHLPADHDVDRQYLDLVARRCALTGGQIRNAVVEAASTALDDGAVLNSSHLHRATQREYQKAGATSPLREGAGPSNAGDGGLEDFIAALGAR